MLSIVSIILLQSLLAYHATVYKSSVAIRVLSCTRQILVQVWVVKDSMLLKSLKMLL